MWPIFENNAPGIFWRVALLGSFLFGLVATAQYGIRALPPSIASRPLLILEKIFLLLGITAVLTRIFWYGIPSVPLEFDSVEYIIGAQRIAEKGLYTFMLNNAEWPIRYPPWISAILLYPLFTLLGATYHVALIIPALSIVLAFSFLYLSAVLSSNRIGGAIAILLAGSLTALPDMVSVVMPDPIIGMLAMALMVALHSYHRTKDLPVWAACGVGIVLAALGALRTTNWILPFFVLLSLKKVSWKKIVCLLTPVVIMAGLSLLSNHELSGFFFRTGYHLWAPLPYDYFNRTFSFYYWSQNITVLIADTLIIEILVLIGICSLSLRLYKPNEPFIGSMLSLATLWIAPFLFYFFSDSRFFLPVELLLILILASLLSSWLNRPNRLFIVISIVIILSASGVLWNSRLTSFFLRERIAHEIMTRTPPDSIIISGINPLFLQTFVAPDEHRIFLPFSRRAEYASKCVLLHPLQERPLTLPFYGQDAFTHRLPEFLQAGCRDVFDTVFRDKGNEANLPSSSSSPVILETSTLTTDDRNWLEGKFKLNPLGEYLVILGPAFSIEKTRTISN
jgi:hypothetical protein